MTQSFSWYYFCLNVGSLAGEAGMPILRQSFGFIIAYLSVAGDGSVVLGLSLLFFK